MLESEFCFSLDECVCAAVSKFSFIVFIELESLFRGWKWLIIKYNVLDKISFCFPYIALSVVYLQYLYKRYCLNAHKMFYQVICIVGRHCNSSSWYFNIEHYIGYIGCWVIHKTLSVSHWKWGRNGISSFLSDVWCLHVPTDIAGAIIILSTVCLIIN